MISSQNPTIWPNLRLSLIIWLLKPSLLLAVQNSTKCAVTNEETALPKILEFVSKSDLESADECLAFYTLKFPKNRDLSFERVRVLAWQKKYEEANVELQKWNDDDAETNLLNAELMRFQGHCKDAAIFYEKARKRQPLSKEAQLNYSRCLAQLEEQRPQDRVIANKLKILTHYSKIVQSQNQSIDKFLVNVTGGVAKDMVASGSFTEARRKSDANKLDDKIIELKIYYSFNKQNLTEFSLGYVNSPKFSFSNYEEIGQQFTTDTWYTGLQVRHTNYLGLSVNRISPYIGLVIERLDALVKTYFSFSENSATYSVFGKLTWQGDLVEPQIYFCTGNDAASRPYLIDSSNSSFFTYGAQISLMNFAWARPFVAAEQRRERQFKQDTLSVGVFWTY